MNGVRYEQGTPAYHRKPRARAASTKSRASSIERGLRMREIHGGMQVFQIIDPAPVAMHVLHVDGGAILHQGVEQCRHVQRLEIRARLQLREYPCEARHATATD